MTVKSCEVRVQNETNAAEWSEKLVEYKASGNSLILYLYKQ